MIRLLRKSILARNTVNVKGVQTEIASGPGANQMHTTTRQIARSRDGRSLARCLEPSSARGCLEADDGIWVRSYDPRTHVLTASRSIAPGRSASDVDRLVRRILAGYRVTLAGKGYIAGRSCYILNLEPFDAFSHVIDVWVDAENGVTLSRRDNSRRGHTFCLTLFNVVSFPASLPAPELRYRLPAGTRTVKTAISPLYRSIARLRRAADFEICVPASMPAGYEFEAAEMVRLQGARTACLRYTDGMSGMTVFERRNPGPAPATHPPVFSHELPKGEAIAMTIHRQTKCFVVAAREVDGLISVIRALDPDRETALLNQLRSRYRVPVSQIADARDRGIGLDCLAALMDISGQTGCKLASLIGLHRNGWDWPDLAQRLRANIQRVADHARPFECR